MARNSSAGSESDGQVEAREKFMQLVTKARRLTEDGNIAGAIRLNEAALAIHFSAKLQKRIAKMKVNHSFKSSCMLFFVFCSIIIYGGKLLRGMQTAICFRSVLMKIFTDMINKTFP